MTGAEKIETEDIFFQNGTKYTSSVFCNGRLIKLSKYFSNGKISQIYEYHNGLIMTKNIYSRDGCLLEKISYSYYDNGEIASIIKEKTNLILSITFLVDDETNNIVSIRIRHNNVIIRKLDYEYSGKCIHCTDIDQNSSAEYTLLKPPIASETWLAQTRANSIVMRKLLVAMSVSA